MADSNRYSTCDDSSAGMEKENRLFAARRFPFEVCSGSPQAGIAGLTVFILADKYGIVVGIALIEPTGSDAELNQFIVDNRRRSCKDLTGMGGAVGRPAAKAVSLSAPAAGGYKKSAVAQPPVPRSAPPPR